MTSTTYPEGIVIPHYNIPDYTQMFEDLKRNRKEKGA